LYVVHRRHPRSFVVPPSFIVCRPLGRLSLSLSLSYGPGAPAIHPMSSCSSVWGWVLCRSSLSSLLSLFVVRCRRPCSLSLSLFVVVIPVIVIRRSSSSSPSSVVCRRWSVHPHSSSTHQLFFVVCHPSPRSTCSPPHEQLLVRLGAGGGVVVGAGGGRFEVGGEGGHWSLGGHGWAGLCCHLPLSVV
jgi:hypothetical protein